MTYRKVKRGVREKAILDVMRGRAISPVARKFGVSRATVHRWMHEARKAIVDLFVRSSEDRDREIVRLRRRICWMRVQFDGMKRKLLSQEVQLKTAQQTVQSLTRIGRPTKCRNCGCEKIYKNGKYRISPAYFSGHLMMGKRRKIEVCHYICAACEESLYIVDPFKNIFRINSDAERGRIISHSNRSAIIGIERKITR